MTRPNSTVQRGTWERNMLVAEAGTQCGNCGVSSGVGGQGLKFCSLCKEVAYCSQRCQRAHWKKHKKACKILQQRRKEMEAAAELAGAAAEVTNTSISSVTGSVLVGFDRDQGNFILPRSRYSVELYDRFLRLHGSTYEYKIQYDDIDRFYMLQKPNGKHFHFVICLDKPILQGQQKYPYLVWMPTNDETKINVNMDEEAIEERFAEQEKHGIKPVMSGALHSLVARVFRAFSGKDVYSHSKRFQSADKNHCISCAHQTVRRASD